MDPPLLQPGDRLGAFEIESLIASGGMGSVYRARNTLTGQLRAVKVILPSLSRDPAFVARFLREVRIAASVRHPNLVEVLEPSQDGQTIYLPMELLVGRTLSACLQGSPRLALPQVAAVLLPVCSAVHAVHQAGIVHRDLKPANIMLASAPDGSVVPKVLDFGAARGQQGDDELTGTGMAIGSVHYMAPEQACGRKDLDARVDQYALGVIAYQMLTGTRPYDQDDSESVVAQIIRNRPYPRPRELVPGLAPELEAVVLRALAYQREGRFASVADFAVALQRVAGVCPVAEPTSPILLRPALVGQQPSDLARTVPEPSRTFRSDVLAVSRSAPPPRPPSPRRWLLVAGVAGLLGAAGAALALFAWPAASDGPRSPAVAPAPPAPLPAPVPATPAADAVMAIPAIGTPPPLPATQRAPERGGSRAPAGARPPVPGVRPAPDPHVRPAAGTSADAGAPVCIPRPGAPCF